MIGDVIVKFGADLKDFTKSVTRAAGLTDEFGRSVTGVTKNITKSFESISDSSKGIEELGSAVSKQSSDISSSFEGINKSHAEMKKTFESMPEFKKYRALTNELKLLQLQMDLTNTRAMLPFAKNLLGVEKNIFSLARSMGTYAGTNRTFIGEVNALGAAHKKATDAMINSNRQLGASIIQTAGQMMNMSTQASKISANYSRLANPIYNVNKAGLAVADSLNRIANNGNAAVLALKALGPNASMKELNDYMTMVNRGIMRFTSVALAATITAGLFYGALAKAASGPDPSEVYAKQAEALAVYQEELNTRTQEIANTWSIFEDIQLASTTPDKLMANLQEQVTALENWRSNLADISSRVGEDFANYLSQMGPAAAGEVAALTSMSAPELDKYVALWKEKMGLARSQAETELSALKAATDAKIAELQASLTPLGLAWEEFKGVWATALQPMVEVFGMIATKVVEFGTAIGNLVVRFNEANPLLGTLLQAVILLLPALTLLLSPLAFGLGLFQGLAAALSAVWAIVGPLITGLLAMSGTVLLVSTAIVGLVAGLVLAYQNIEWFREMVNTVWNAIVLAWTTALNAISTAVQTVMAFINVYLQQILAYAQQLWATHGEAIMTHVMTIYNAIKGFITTYINAAASIIQAVLAKIQAFWSENGTTIMAVVRGAFQFISTTIQSVMQLVMGIIRGGLQFISGLFQAVMPIVSGLVQVSFALIKTIISSVIDVISGLVQTFAAIFRGDWEGAFNAVMGIVEDIMGNIVSTFEGIDLLQIGKNIINGLISGISSMGDAVWDAVKSIGSSIKDSFTSFFDINSPSRVMKMDVGRWIPAGIGVGIEKGTSSVMKAAQRMAEDITRAATPSMPSIASPDVRGFERSINGKMRATAEMVSGNMAFEGGQPNVNLTVRNEWDGNQVRTKVNQENAWDRRKLDRYRG